MDAAALYYPLYKTSDRTVQNMKKSALSPLLALALAGAAFADAIVFPDESVNVDYYVYVTTPDGGLNLREGPGVDYSIITTIPDY